MSIRVVVFLFATNNPEMPEVCGKHLFLHEWVWRSAVAWLIQPRLAWVRLDARLSPGLRFSLQGFILRAQAEGAAATGGMPSQQGSPRKQANGADPSKALAPPTSPSLLLAKARHMIKVKGKIFVHPTAMRPGEGVKKYSSITWRE